MTGRGHCWEDSQPMSSRASGVIYGGLRGGDNGCAGTTESRFSQWRFRTMKQRQRERSSCCPLGPMSARLGCFYPVTSSCVSTTPTITLIKYCNNNRVIERLKTGKTSQIWLKALLLSLRSFKMYQCRGKSQK